MANIKIREIYRDMINTKYGEKEVVTDINGDEVNLNGRRITGFKDKSGETDKWVAGMTIKVQIATKKSIGKDGDEMEWVNFRLPEGVSSIVSEASDDF